MREGLDITKMEWGRKKTQVKKAQFLELIARVEVLEKEVARLKSGPVADVSVEKVVKKPVKKVVKKAV